MARIVDISDVNDTTIQKLKGTMGYGGMSVTVDDLNNLMEIVNKRVRQDFIQVETIKYMYELLELMRSKKYNVNLENGALNDSEIKEKLYNIKTNMQAVKKVYKDKRSGDYEHMRRRLEYIDKLILMYLNRELIAEEVKKGGDIPCSWE